MLKLLQGAHLQFKPDLWLFLCDAFGNFNSGGCRQGLWMCTAAASCFPVPGQLVTLPQGWVLCRSAALHMQLILLHLAAIQKPLGMPLGITIAALLRQLSIGSSHIAGTTFQKQRHAIENVWRQALAVLPVWC